MGTKSIGVPFMVYDAPTPEVFERKRILLIGDEVSHCGVLCTVVALDGKDMIIVHYVDRVGVIQQISVPKDAIK